MIKLKAPEGVTQVSINGEVVEIKNGICEVNAIVPFLLDNGFEIVAEAEEKPKARKAKKEGQDDEAGV